MIGGYRLAGSSVIGVGSLLVLMCVITLIVEGKDDNLFVVGAAALFGIGIGVYLYRRGTR